MIKNMNSLKPGDERAGEVEGGGHAADQGRGEAGLEVVRVRDPREERQLRGFHIR